MDLISPYRGFPRWYRGNTHAHTACSDGDTPVRGLIEAYEARGYDFLAITDHDRVSNDSSAPTRRLLILRSTEVTVRGRLHVCALGVRDATELSTRPPSPQAAVAMIHRCGGLPILCHPEWSHLTDDVILSLIDVSLVEIANAVCNRLEFNGFALGLWDRLLQSGRVVWGVAADDAHRGRHDIGRAWVVVNAVSLS
ncbi:MAG TPA: CehA/McbA family metallohydrolase, partial [Nitrospiraceae bacterium]|nr:CehA/McbA family metallohydrolase [Nitrospiraceae bacterium]